MGNLLISILREYIEALANNINEPAEFASSEEMLHIICKLNKQMNSITNPDEIVFIAFDVIGLYPSLYSRETSKVIAKN